MTEAARSSQDPRSELYCPDCAYSLRGLPGRRCPECGLDLSFIDAPDGGIRWARVDRGNALLAFLETAVRVVFSPTRFCREVCRPIDLRRALAFQRVVILVLFAALPLFLVGWEVREAGAISTLRREWTDPILALVLVAGIVAVRLTMAARSSLVLSGPDAARRERVALLACYAAAPLILLPIGVGIAALLSPSLPTYVALSLPIALFVPLFWAYWLTLYVVRRTLRSTWSVLLLAIAWPLIGALLALWVVGGTLALSLYFGVAIWSIAG